MKANGFSPVKAGNVVSDIDSHKGIFIGGKHFPSTEARNLWEKSKSPAEYSMGLLTLVRDFLNQEPMPLTQE